MTAAASAPIIEARGLTKRFLKAPDLAERASEWLGGKAGGEVVRAVDSVSLTIGKGEVVGLAGESGCGKSTLGRMIAGLLEPSDGVLLYKGRDRATLTGAQAKAARLAVQMIFQDPYSSLNPRLRVEAAVGEAPLVHGLVSRADVARYVADILKRVGLDPELRRRFPHQFSGGQRSRIGIARALAVKPEFLVCDEAIAALDVSIQAQIINLFLDLREAYDLTYLFISHDLGVVQHICDRILIMYLGRIVEAAPTARAVRVPQPPLHAGVAGGGAAHLAHQAHLPSDQGRDPLAAGSSPRLPLPSPLPARHAALPHRGARTQGDRARSHLRLPSQRRLTIGRLIRRAHASLAQASWRIERFR